MSITVIKEEISSSDFLARRKARIEEIIRKHSQRIFGHSGASISEIRGEAIKRKLEDIFNK